MPTIHLRKISIENYNKLIKAGYIIKFINPEPFSGGYGTGTRVQFTPAPESIKQVVARVETSTVLPYAALSERKRK